MGNRRILRTLKQYAPHNRLVSGARISCLGERGLQATEGQWNL
jgi:hypothetical protein